MAYLRGLFRLSVASALLQLAGLGAVSVGIGLVFAPAGIVVGGVSLFALGLITGLPPRSRPQ